MCLHHGKSSPSTLYIHHIQDGSGGELTHPLSLSACLSLSVFLSPSFSPFHLYKRKSIHTQTQPEKEIQDKEIKTSWKKKKKRKKRERKREREREREKGATRRAKRRVKNRLHCSRVGCRVNSGLPLLLLPLLLLPLLHWVTTTPYLPTPPPTLQRPQRRPPWNPYRFSMIPDDSLAT